MVHVVDRDFGAGLSPFKGDSPMMQTYLSVKSKDDFTNHLIHLQDYDELYDLYDPRIHSGRDPQPTLGYNAMEDPWTGSMLECYLREIVTCKLPDIFKMSAMDLMNLPKYVLEPYLAEGRKARNAEVELRRKMEQDEKDANKQINLPL